MRLEIDTIDTFYGETQALFGISLTVGVGEVVALIGPNGAGKTTILRSVLGLTPARSGHIRFDGTDITHAEAHTIARAGVGWVPDDRRVFPDLTVARNLEIARKAGRFRSWALDELFEVFPRLAPSHGPRGRQPVGWRGADGGDRPRASWLARPVAAR